MAATTRDHWAEWVLRTRFRDDPSRREELLAELIPVRDRVLDNAHLRDTDILLDIGTGDGLIAFGALDRFGPSGRVILSDISQDLLDHSRKTAEEMGIADRCQFLRAPADDLAEIDDGSVGVVTTRSVLIYLAADNKRRALREFYRVLKRGGRLSIFEPINRYGHEAETDTFWGYDITPVADLAAKIRAAEEAAHPRASHPLLDFDERDLLRWVEEVGFDQIHMSYEVEVLPEPWFDDDWCSFLKLSGNPLDATVEEKVHAALTAQEADTFFAHLRPLVEGRQGTKRSAAVYLSATKNRDRRLKRGMKLG